MNVNNLKEYILDNDYIEDILEDIGCNKIKNHGEYISATNIDGDAQSIVIYKNENLTCIDYTRTLAKDKRSTDIFDLVSFNLDVNFPKALKHVHDLLGLDFYDDTSEEIPESLQLIQLFKEMKERVVEDIDVPLKPIPEKVLSYYLPYGNIMFEDDGISLKTQMEWEIGFDCMSNAITIPLRDELGNLIAVKARRFKYTQSTPLSARRFNDVLEDSESKYYFIEKGAKSQILYGLYKNFKLIQQQGICYVGESEKFCMQLYDMGFYGVSTGGSKLSKRQIEILTRLGTKIVFCFDKDISEDELKNIAESFFDGISIYAIIDKDNILGEKESPSDNKSKWDYLIKNNIYMIKN